MVFVFSCEPIIFQHLVSNDCLHLFWSWNSMKILIHIWFGFSCFQVLKIITNKASVAGLLLNVYMSIINLEGSGKPDAHIFALDFVFSLSLCGLQRIKFLQYNFYWMFPYVLSTWKNVKTWYRHFLHLLDFALPDFSKDNK